MTDGYDYDREFRLKILALSLDDVWMAKYGDAIIKPAYFELDDEIAFITAVMQYRQKYNKSPMDPTDVITLCNGNFSVFILDMYELFDEGDFSLASDIAVQFAREQAVKLAILDSIDDVNAGRLLGVVERVKEAVSVGEGIESPGIDPIADIDTWLYDYWSEKVRTGWTHVDRILEGGSNPGEFGFILGPQNRGKSMSLVNLGYAAASIGSGKNVVHFVHEMSEQQTAKRYVARMLFRFPKPTDNLKEYAEEAVTAAHKLLTGKIRIIRDARTTIQIEAKLKQLQAEGFEVGEILDDYLDKITPPKHYSNIRFELSAIYDWYRNLCYDFQVPGWSASQSGRQSFSKEIITMQDVAEDINKCSIADNIIAVCQTRDEEDAELCRLFMAKVRDGDSRATIRAKYYKKSQSIITTDYVISKKEEKDV